MADRELSNILNSGEISTIYLGGVTSSDTVVKKSALDATNANVTANTAFDNTSTSLTSTTKQDAIVELANVGLGHMMLVTPYTGGQTIGTSPVKISLFDTIHHDINGALTPTVDTNESTPAHLFTIDKGGLYSVYGTVTAEFSSSSAVSLQLYKNGVAFGVPVEIQGRGAGKPVQFAYNDLADLVATDYLEVYASSDTASTSVLITATSMIVERKPLS